MDIKGIHIEFILFALTLIGVALFHKHTLKIAFTGLAIVLIYKLLFTDFNIINHLHLEWKILFNLFGLILGFLILAKYFEDSGIPDFLPRHLPDDWKGGFVLLILIFFLSSFLDNIAAAMIGGAIAHVVFKKKVHIGYIAAIVAASNAGGSGSVLGDTTTTMMWIDGVAPTDVLHAYMAAIPAFIFFGIIASIQQDKYQRILKEEAKETKIDWWKILIVLMILAGAIITGMLWDFPAVGIWLAIIIGAFFRRAPWKKAVHALSGSVFLVSLVLCASMMPVEELPSASWQTALSLGFISSFFDNIPLTKLALDQGGYDWGFLAYAVGFGGSMIWFGSSAGVAISTMYGEAKSVSAWIKGGWHIAVAYLIGFFILFYTLGWHPHAPHKSRKTSVQENSSPVKHF